MSEPTKKQEEALREFLHSAVVPLIEDVLVKKLGQAMSYAKEQLDTPKQWVGLTDEERDSIARDAAKHDWHDYIVISATEAALRSKNNG